MGPVAIAEYTASGAVTGATMIHAITVTDGTSVEVKVGGSGGTTVLTLEAVADSSVVFTPSVPFGVYSCYLTITGSGAVSVLYT